MAVEALILDAALGGKSPPAAAQTLVSSGKFSLCSDNQHLPFRNPVIKHWCLNKKENQSLSCILKNVFQKQLLIGRVAS